MSSTFAWPDTPNRLREFAANGEPTLDVERGVFFRGDDDDRAEFHPPLVLGPRGATASVDDYLRAWTGSNAPNSFCEPWNRNATPRMSRINRTPVSSATVEFFISLTFLAAGGSAS